MSLMSGEKLCRCEVIFEMNRSEPSLCFTNLRGQLGQHVGRYLLFCELTVERAFLLDQCLADRDCLRLHRLKKLLDALALCGAELKLVGKFKNMERSGISVHLAG